MRTDYTHPLATAFDRAIAADPRTAALAPHLGLTVRAAPGVGLTCLVMAAPVAMFEPLFLAKRLGAPLSCDGLALHDALRDIGEGVIAPGQSFALIFHPDAADAAAEAFAHARAA